MVYRSKSTLMQLCSRVYPGLSRERVLAIICGPSGVSRHAVAAAYDGRRVRPETADYLLTWAREVHGAELDVLAMLRADVSPRPRPPAERADALVADAIRRAGLPDVAMVVSMSVERSDESGPVEVVAGSFADAIRRLSEILVQHGRGDAP